MPCYPTIYAEILSVLSNSRNLSFPRKSSSQGIRVIRIELLFKVRFRNELFILGVLLLLPPKKIKVKTQVQGFETLIIQQRFAKH